MTNQEAIDIIKTAIAEVEWDYPMAYAAAFDMAIEALKEQEDAETRLVRHYSRPGVYDDLWLHCEKCGGKIDDGFYRAKFCPYCGRRVKRDAETSA